MLVKQNKRKIKVIQKICQLSQTWLFPRVVKTSGWVYREYVNINFIL